LKHPELAIDEYRASGPPRDNLLDADEDDGGTANLARQQVLDTTKTADDPTD
jgi:cytochrome c oxidase subunit 1